jgi:predicted metal-dependent phosphoesterase TrpH
VARELVAGGHVHNIQDAFDRYLASGKPAFIPRRGSTPAEVVGILGRAGGIASLAHPGKLGLDALVAPLASAGLAAVEVFHPDHDGAMTEKYDALAALHGLARSGGSDYHGPGSGRAERLGDVTLPAAMFEDLERRAARR